MKRSPFLYLAQLLNLQAVWLDVMLLNMKPYSEDYRVVERNSQHNIGPNNMGRFGIFEAHYGGDGELALITTVPIAPTAKTVEELKALLQEYLQALEQPIIQFDDVPKHHRESIKLHFQNQTK